MQLRHKSGCLTFVSNSPLQENYYIKCDLRIAMLYRYGCITKIISRALFAELKISNKKYNFQEYSAAMCKSFAFLPIVFAVRRSFEFLRRVLPIVNKMEWIAVFCYTEKQHILKH